MNAINELIVTHPFQSEKRNPDADFFALLSFVKGQGIRYCLLNFDINANPLEYFEQIKKNEEKKVVYLHIEDITYLGKLKTIFSILKDRDCLIIVGGHHSITSQSWKVMDTFKDIDAILRTPEAEKVLVNLINAIFSGRNWKSVKGITYRNIGSNNRIVVNQNQSLSKNLDHLSSLGIYDLQLSNYEWYPIIISRGCFYNCRYCISPMPYPMDNNRKKYSWRKKSVKKVVDEMEFLLSKGINKFQFYCDQFFESKTDQDVSAVLIAKEIIKRNLNVKLKFFSKPCEIRNNFESIPVLIKAGLEDIGIGIDSGVKRFHEMYKTGSTIADIIEVLKFLHEHQLRFYTSFIFFEPYLTIEEIKETIIFLKTIAPYFSHLEQSYSGYLDSRVLRSVLILRHGIPILRELRRDGLLFEYSNFSNHPAATFMDPQVKNVYSIYRSVNQILLPKIRHFFYDKTLVEKNNFLNLFPLKLLEKILISVTKKKFEKIEDYIPEIKIFIKKNFSICID